MGYLYSACTMRNESGSEKGSYVRVSAQLGRIGTNRVPLRSCEWQCAAQRQLSGHLFAGHLIGGYLFVESLGHSSRKSSTKKGGDFPQYCMLTLGMNIRY